MRISLTLIALATAVALILSFQHAAEARSLTGAAAPQVRKTKAIRSQSTREVVPAFTTV